MTVGEVDSRTIPGNGGRVVWQYETTYGEHLVAVYREDCSLLSIVATFDGVEAREFYRHPFASASTPDIFTPAGM